MRGLLQACGSEVESLPAPQIYRAAVSLCFQWPTNIKLMEPRAFSGDQARQPKPGTAHSMIDQSIARRGSLPAEIRLLTDLRREQGYSQLPSHRFAKSQGTGTLHHPPLCRGGPAKNRDEDRDGDGDGDASRFRPRGFTGGSGWSSGCSLAMLLYIHIQKTIENSPRIPARSI